MTYEFLWLNSLRQKLKLNNHLTKIVNTKTSSVLTIHNLTKTLTIVLTKSGSKLKYDLTFRDRGLRFKKEYTASHSINNWKQFIQKELRFIDRFKYRKHYSLTTSKDNRKRKFYS